MSEATITKLTRGGWLVKAVGRQIQFGVPPETIKDTMVLPDSVPDCYVLPREMFNWHKGICVAEIEFPVYFNFFIKKRKTRLICQADQADVIRKILQESVFGPETLNVREDYDADPEALDLIDLQAEMKFFRSNFTIDDLVEFIPFVDQVADLGDLSIRATGRNYYLLEQGQPIAEIPDTVDYNAAYRIGQRLAEPFIPPLFGVTCLGPSHGFDPTSNTSGFIVWLNHIGLMIDPPVNSTEWLLASNVNPKLIDGIILTHCHADHDAGTFQKILEEHRISIYTTKTIMDSFMRKYSATTGESEDRLRKLFDFNQIKIDRKLYIHGAEFKMFYSVHSIPTIGFAMTFQDQSFVYTSDHNNDPAKHLEMLDKGIISGNRYRELKDFPWSFKVIYHEAGIPPLHTPVAFLNSLSDRLQSKIVVYHIAEKDFPKDTKLTLARFGIEHTLQFKVRQPDFEKDYQILGLLKHLDFFQDINIGKAQEFITIVQEEHYRKGQLIIKKDSPGDKFYIIYMGNVSVTGHDLAEKKIYGSFDYFGEVALVTQSRRAADVYAETDVVLYTIERDKFLNFISGTEFEKMLVRLARIRNSETWNLLSNSPLFRLCTATQKTWLESMFVPTELAGAGSVLAAGDSQNDFFIIRRGEIEVRKDGQTIARLGNGDFIGSISRIYYDQPIRYDYHHTSQVSLYTIRRADIVKFADKNPGLLMRLRYEFGN